MHALVLLCIYQYTKFELPSFTNYKDMIGAKFKNNGSRDFDHASFRGGLSSLCWDFTQPTRMQNLTTVAS